MALSPGDPGYAQETKGPLTITITATLTSLCLLFVIARVYSRFVSIGKLAIDDYIVIFSIILSIIYVALAAVAIGYGAGRHITTLSPADTGKAIYYIVIAFVPGVTSFVVPKFAGIILLAKLLNPGKIHRIIMWIISVVYLLMAAAMLTINFAQCTPAAAQWGGAEGTCWDRKITVSFAITVSVLSVLFDFYLAIYPTIVLRTLQMNWKKKVALCVALSFGYIAGAVTLYKCATLWRLTTLLDFTFAIDDVVLWTNIEANCVLIGVCIPTLIPLAKKLFGSSVLGGSSGRKSGAAAAAGMNNKSGGENAIHTIGGSSSHSHSRKKRTKSLSQFDTAVDDDGTDNKYIMLEDRSFRMTASDAQSDDASVLEKGRATRHAGW